jgi:hypothetical protein
MLHRLKEKPLLQVAFVATVLALAALLEWLTGFRPTMRGTFLTFVQGVAGGVFISILLIGSFALIRQWKRKSLLDLSSYPLQPLAVSSRVGAAFAAAGGEEVLLRGHIFAFLNTLNTSFALLVNFILSSLLYFSGRSSLPVAILRGLEAILYALLYSVHHSLLLVATAHFVAELFTNSLLSSQRFWATIERELPLMLSYLQHLRKRGLRYGR